MVPSLSSSRPLLLLIAAGIGCHKPPVVHSLAVGGTYHGPAATLQLEVPESGATLYVCPSEAEAPLPSHRDIRAGWGRFTSWESGLHDVDLGGSGRFRAWLSSAEDLAPALDSASREFLQAGSPGFAAALALDLAGEGHGSAAPIEEWARSGVDEVAGATTLLRLAIRAEGQGEWDRALALFVASYGCERLPVHLRALGLCWQGSLLAHRLDEPGVRGVLTQLEAVLPDLDPQDRFLRELDLLNILHRVGDRLQAQALLESLDQRDQRVVATYELDRIRSFLLEEAGEYHAAKDAIERAIRDCSDAGELYGLEINRGRILRLMGRPEQATEVFEAASRMPEAASAPFLYQVGRGYARLEASTEDEADLLAARAELEEAWDVLRQYPARPDYQLPFLEPLTLLELRTGHSAAAAKYLGLAEDLLAETRADDEYLRSRFGRWSRLGQAVSALERRSQGLDAWPGLARSLAWKSKAGRAPDPTAAGLQRGLSHARMRLAEGPPKGLVVPPPKSQPQRRASPWLALDLCLGEDRLYGYLLDAAGELRVLELGSSQEAREHLGELDRLLSARVLNAEDYRRACRSMTASWVDPVLAENPSPGGILVSAPAEFARVHLAALPASSAEGAQQFDELTFVGDRVEVVYMPSLLPLFAPPKAKAQAQEKPQALVVGNPARADVPSLPHAENEARAVARHLEATGYDVHLLVGPDATRSRVLAKLPACEVIHLATHAVQDNLFPSRSGALLAPDAQGDRLTVRDLQSLDLAGPKVVLSACASADGLALAAGSVSLPAGFLAAGARSVVASTHAVGDASAQRWALSWHQARSLPSAEAFRVQPSRSSAAESPIITRARDPRHWGRWKGYWSGD